MSFKPFKIRDIEINPPLVLSPMAGVTDISFRRLLKRRGGVGLTVSEFISVEGLTQGLLKKQLRPPFASDISLRRRTVNSSRSTYRSNIILTFISWSGRFVD